MQALLRERGLEQSVFVDSAGTIGYHAGHEADPRMQRAARNRGFELSSLSRKITYADLEAFDLVIAMDRENFADIQTVHPEASSQIMLLSEFLDDSWPTDVPDPYYGGADGFEYVIDMIQAACPGILRHLESL